MSGKPIDEAVLELIAEARRAANVLHMAAHPHESPHKRPLLDAAIDQARGKGVQLGETT